MIENALFFVAGLVVAVVSPPVFKFTAHKIEQFNAWRKS